LLGVLALAPVAWKRLKAAPAMRSKP